MNIKYQYAKCRVADGIQELCVSPGDVRSRLLAANDAMSSLDTSHFPEHLQPKWDSIMSMMTKYGPAKNFEGVIWQGAVAHTMRKIKNVTGTKIAASLWELHEMLQTDS
ncbi:MULTISPECIES: hypothetical protein [Vibrio]|uniref:hypothetical protein n=1 Tax=Vibrio TaxID=662 RepID=UPI0002EF812D|nr:hypothetical protein [Vibrio tasmaniensis]OEF78428.1 hypothetical protein A162_16365 [Vibrio tasmaniensis 1F-155]PMO78749.1 hypothetical protein BCT01_12035 [Vibrio tasmaniensis]